MGAYSYLKAKSFERVAIKYQSVPSEPSIMLQNNIKSSKVKNKGAPHCGNQGGVGHMKKRREINSG